VGVERPARFLLLFAHAANATMNVTNATMNVTNAVKVALRIRHVAMRAKAISTQIALVQSWNAERCWTKDREYSLESVRRALSEFPAQTGPS